MPSLLQVQKLAKAYGAQQLFSGFRFGIEPGERVGLIGPNGSGKSTLLKILAGLETPDAGELARQKGLRVGHLAQNEILDDDRNLADNLLAAGRDAGLAETEIHTRALTLLSRAGFADPEARAGALSGGLRKRLALCRALMPAPELLLLDEPTNHLDIAGILWLEKLLLAAGPDSPAAFVVISHDRRFLENTVNRVIELAPVYPDGALSVRGGYADFVEKRREFLEERKLLEERLANAMRRETEWLRRGPKARTTKAKYRIDAAFRLQEELDELRGRNRAAGSGASRAGIRFEGTERKTKKLLEAKGLAKSFGDRTLFSGLGLTLAPGVRIGLLGDNGCGKSTLMRILASAAGEQPGIAPDRGTIRVAEGLRLVSFDQRREQLDTGVTLRRALAPEGDSVVYQGRSVHVAGWAKRFLFRGDQLETPVSRLSGGEQARILLARLMLRPADALLLDEPTNDLDIPALNVLEESLSEFPGALVLVSHDRFLLDRLCTHILGFDGRGHTAWFADCDQWLDWLEATADAEPRPDKPKAPPQSENAPKKPPKPGKLSYLEQREYDGMEECILEAEAALAALEARMAEPDITADAANLAECWREREALVVAIEAMYRRWSELEERKG